MKSVLLVPLLLLPLTASAGPEISIGASGGVMVTDPLEVIGSGWYVTPRLGFGIDDNLGIELETGFQGGTTRIGEYPYSAVTPRVNLVGKLWSRGKRNADGTYGKPPPIHPLLAVGAGMWIKNTQDDGALGVAYQRNDIDFLANAGPGLMVPLGPAHLRTDLRWVRHPAPGCRLS